MNKALRLTLATVLSLLVTGGASRGLAQATTQASLAIVFAVSTPGKSFIELDGRDLNPSGFMASRSTGWIQLATGKHSLRAEQQPGGEAKVEMELSTGQRKILILHTEFVTSDKPGRPPKPELRLTVIDHLPNPKPSAEPRLLRLYSVLPTALTLSTDQPEVAEIPTEPKKLQALGFKGKVGFITLTEKTEPPAAEPLISVNFQEPSTFFIVLYEAEAGKRKALSLEAP